MKHQELICTECGHPIDESGNALCSYECSLDGQHIDERPVGSVVVRIYERVDTFIGERTYIPNTSDVRREADEHGN